MSALHGAVHPDADPAPADPLRLFDDDGNALGRVPGDERPADAREDCGHSRHTTGLDALAQPGYIPPEPEPHPNYRPLLAARFSRVESVRGLLLARGRDGELVTPLVARGPVERGSRPSYPGSTSRVLGRIDEAVSADAAWADNARLRKERDAALADAATERVLKRDALAWLGGAQARIGELELTVQSLGRKLDATARALDVVGEVIVHVDAHAAKGGGSDG